MSPYELMIKTNHYLIKGGKLTEKQTSFIYNQLMSARSTGKEANRFYYGVKFPGNIDNSGRRMYPIFYIPPYNNGKKLKTIFSQTPKTHILSANMYELEILRLLYVLAPEQTEVIDMIDKTLNRLKTTCFGYHDDGVGECFDTSLVVLRFISTVAQDQTEWIQNRIDNYNNHAQQKKRSWHSGWYYWLCLSEMPFDLAKPELDKYKETMINILQYKSYVMNSEQDKCIHPVIISMIRNAIAKYPEYEYIKDLEPYVSDKDGRLHFSMA